MATPLDDALRQTRRSRALASSLAFGGLELELVEPGSTDFAGFGPSFWKVDETDLTQIRDHWARLDPRARQMANTGILLAAGSVSVGAMIYGERFPDFDIKFLGIGMHRFWLFHSAIAAWAAQDFLKAVTLSEEGGTSHPAVTKLCAAAIAGGAVGIGIHLVRDGAFGLIEGEKSVVFGIPGLPTRNTLIKGTYVDDDLWLLGNALWAFKIAHDVVVLAYANEFEVARDWVETMFGKAGGDGR